METAIENKNAEIIELLESSTCAHLADCLDLIPEANLEAIRKMNAADKANGMVRASRRYKVVQDVAALVEGHIPALLSAQYVEQEKPVCQQCSNHSERLEKVQIPGVDIAFICPDCLRSYNPGL